MKTIIYGFSLLLISSTAACTSPSKVTTDSQRGETVTGTITKSLSDREQQARKERVELLLAQGDIAAREGRIEYAFHLLLNAEQIDSSDDRALVRAGNLHRTLGNRELAVKAWQLALMRNPSNGNTHESLGFSLLESGRFDEAAKAFEQAVLLTTDRKRSMIGLGLACEKRRDYERALTIYDAALLDDPSSVELLTYRARSLMNLWRLSEAKAAIASIINEPIQATWIVRGDLFAIDGDYAAALGSYLEGLSEQWAYQRLGEHALRQGALAHALRYFREAAAASPRFFPDAENAISITLEKLRDK
jgi:tetratricopeptide (TPR) repeat protein